jgi:hypothetical protein
LSEKLPGGKLSFGSTAKSQLSDTLPKLAEQYKALGGNGEEELMTEAIKRTAAGGITQGLVEGAEANWNMNPG